MSKKEAIVLSRELIDCTLQVGRPQVKEFRYLGVLFMNESRKRSFGAAGAGGLGIALL